MLQFIHLCDLGPIQNSVVLWYTCEKIKDAQGGEGLSGKTEGKTEKNNSGLAWGVF